MAAIIPDEDLEKAQIEDITKIVLNTLQKWEGVARPAPWWKRIDGFLVSHWVLIAFLASLVGLAVAHVKFDASLTYPFREIAFRDQELQQRKLRFDHEKEKFAHERERFKRTARQELFKRSMADDLVALAESFLDVGQLKEAEQVYSQARKIDDTNVEARLGLVKSQAFKLSAAGQYDPEVIKRRLAFVLTHSRVNSQVDNASAPGAYRDPHALTLLGNLYALSDSKRAAGYFEEALSYRPTVAEAHFGLANLRMEKGRFAEAAELLRQATDVSPANHRYLGNLAYAYTRLGDFEKAVKAYRSLLQLNTRVIQPYLELANAYRLNNQLKPAGQVLSIVAPMLEGNTHFEVPKNRDPWYFPTRSGRVFLTDPDAKRMYAYLSYSATYFLLDRREEARKYAARARSHKGSVDTKSALKLISHDLRELEKRHEKHSVRIANFHKTHMQVGWFQAD